MRSAYSRCIAFLDHAADQTRMERAEAALALPGCHRAAQRVGLAGREVGGQDRQLHHLLLEDRHAERALQRTLHFVARVVHRLFAAAPLQIRMHHAALDRPRPHDGDLDHQVVEVLRFQARQHAHLRAALDLEHADAVAAAEHLVDRLVLGHLAARAQHLLHRPRRCSFWPTNSSARCTALSMPSASTSTLIRPSVSRSSLSHWITVRLSIAAFSTGTRRDTSSRAITKPPGCWLRWRGKPIRAWRQLDPQLADRRVGIEAVLAQAFGVDLAAVEPMLAACHRGNAIEVDAHRAAHVAQRRARPVADHHRGQRGAVAAVLAVDVLDHLLAALVLEVDVDVGRLVALGADEALEQQLGALGVDLGHLQAITHRWSWPHCRGPGRGSSAPGPSARCRPR